MRAMKKTTRIFFIMGSVLVGIFAVLDFIAKKKAEPTDIDTENPYIDNLDLLEVKYRNVYIDTVKPALDKMLSFGGLVVLSGLFAGISLAVWIDDPGPVFFTQKRIGKDKHYMMIHKFRSMRSNAPHDIPTHLLDNPDQYLTKVGRVLRMTSLDELPQIWDIFRGRMSVIGPRPALWNQDDLIAERDKYRANDIMPGLTGLAQIKGRDELEISEKAQLDGEYTAALCAGGVKAFVQDVRCFIGTVMSVVNHDGVVEGGTGNLRI